VQVPKIVDHDARRREIIHAAWRVIARSGFEGANLRDIAQEAGFTTGVIGYYFRHKEELLQAALRLTTEESYERLASIKRRLRGLAAVRAAADNIFPTTRSTEWAVWLCFWGRSIGNDLLTKEHRLRYEEWRDTLAGFFAEARDLGEILPDSDPQEEADRLVALLYGIAVQAIVNDLPPARQRRILDRHLDSVAAK